MSQELLSQVLGTEIEFAMPVFDAPTLRSRMCHDGVECPAAFPPASLGYDGSVYGEWPDAPEGWSGFEWRSEPQTLAAWQAEYRTLARWGRWLEDMDSQADDNPSTGGHIHVDFGADRDAGFRRAQRLATLLHAHSDVFKALSGRHTFGWCSMDEPRYGEWSKGRAINARPSYTIELRFWQATLDARTLLGQLEWSALLNQWAMGDAPDTELAPLLHQAQAAAAVVPNALALWQRRVGYRMPLPPIVAAVPAVEVAV